MQYKLTVYLFDAAFYPLCKIVYFIVIPFKMEIIIIKSLNKTLLYLYPARFC